MSADEPPRRIPPKRPGSVSEDRDKRRDYHTPKHGIPVTTFPMPPTLAQEAVPNEWETAAELTPVALIPPPGQSQQQQLAAIDKTTRKAATLTNTTLGEISAVRTEFRSEMASLSGEVDETRETVIRLEEKFAGFQRTLDEVLTERRNAQGVIAELAIARSKSTLQREEKDADVRRTITTKAALAIIGLISAITAAIAYWIGKGAPSP